MHHEKIPVQEYEKLPAQFNPTLYSAREWVELVKRAGMRYITITAKHHDGFCMYDSQYTDYKITNTPFKRDAIGEIAHACKRQDIDLLFYYSPLDWHHPAYKTDWEAYTQYWHNQVLELFQKYQPMGIWLDGCWDKPENLDKTWRLSQLYQAIRKIKPDAIIGNNHHQAPLDDEDIQTFEQDLPGENKVGFNPIKPVENALYETCMTINNSWGYNAGDTAHKSPPELIRILAICATRDANLLLNVGPRPDGTIQPEHVERLEAIGKWLSTYGESIYQTRGCVFTDTPWGGCTRKGNTLYLHIWQAQPKQPLRIEGVERQVMRVQFVNPRTPLNYRHESRTLLIELPDSLPEPANTVVKVEIK